MCEDYTPADRFKEYKVTESGKMWWECVTAKVLILLRQIRQSHICRWRVMRAAVGRARGLPRSLYLGLSLSLDCSGQNKFCSYHFEEIIFFLFLSRMWQPLSLGHRKAFKRWRHFSHFPLNGIITALHEPSGNSRNLFLDKETTLDEL